MQTDHGSGGRAPLTPAAFHILLAVSDRERHGYGIMQEVSAMTDGSVTLGPGTCTSLLADGLIEESSQRPDPALDDERRRCFTASLRWAVASLSPEAERLAALAAVSLAPGDCYRMLRCSVEVDHAHSIESPRSRPLQPGVSSTSLRTCPRRFQLAVSGRDGGGLPRLVPGSISRTWPVWSGPGVEHGTPWISRTNAPAAARVTSGLISLTTQWLPFEVVPAATAMSNPIGVRAESVGRC